MMKLEEGDKITYENYWEKDDLGIAEVIEVVDTIFSPSEERADEEMKYIVKDLQTGREFEIDDIDYWFEIKE